MIVNLNADISLNMKKPEERPSSQWFYDLEEKISKLLTDDETQVTEVEIIDINFYDDEPEEEEIEWD